MNMLATTAQTPAKVTPINKNKLPRDKFVLGDSECNFEVTPAGTGKLTAEQVQSVLVNPNTKINPSNGAGLSVSFIKYHDWKGEQKPEFRHIGFINRADGDNMEMKDLPDVLKAAEDYVIKASSFDELIELF